MQCCSLRDVFWLLNGYSLIRLWYTGEDSLGLFRLYVCIVCVHVDKQETYIYMEDMIRETFILENVRACVCLYSRIKVSLWFCLKKQ